MKGRFTDERAEAGETLLEVMFTVLLLGLCVVGIIGGLATTLAGSKAHRDQANANAALVTAMEDLKSSSIARLCPVGAATKPGYVLPTNVSITEIAYQTHNAATGNVFDWSTAAAACDDTWNSNTATPAEETDVGAADPDNPLSLQRITLQYTTPGSSVSPALTFVKGKY